VARWNLPVSRRRELAPEDVVSFAIMDLGVEPLRAGWQSVLVEAAER
jgi:hypothetical protein